MRDTLFVLTPGFADKGKRWFCPFSAQVIGMLAYYPQVRDTLEVVELDFPKPRQPVVDLLGPDHQAVPILVLHPGSPADVDGVHVKEANGHRFVEKTLEIVRYLAATRGVPLPH